jgi:hypothetical protein
MTGTRLELPDLSGEQGALFASTADYGSEKHK